MTPVILKYRDRFRKHGQVPFNFGELIIDNFAGGGGASTGIEQAMGRPVDVAINHDPGAIAMHEVNHPHTRHYCESVWDVDPLEVTGGRPVGLAWFSPDCKHFSKAKGAKPVEKKIRGLAWVVLRWAAKVRPRVIMLENVEEFVTWGPLVRKDDGLCYPCPKNKGRTFNSFVNALRRHGYVVEHKELRACDYGAPTIRKRLFLVARCDGQSVAWPEPTHGDPNSEAVKSGRLLPWRTAAECIDWSVPCPSIFERNRPLADATLRRIAKGIMRYVVNNPDPFIVPLTHHGKRKNHIITEPFPTVTAAHRGELALVTPVLTEHANASSPRCMAADEPLRTICAETKGGHHALVSAFLAKHYGGVVGHGVNQPAGTVTTADHHSLVTANLVRNYGTSHSAGVTFPHLTITSKNKDSLVTSHLVKTCREGQSVNEPLHTISTQGQYFGEVRAFLLQYHGMSESHDMHEPLNTISTRDRFGLVTVSGQEYCIVDIGMRMLTPQELFKAQGFPADYIIDRDSKGKPITKTEQVKRCGNSVSPFPAAALVRANMSTAAGAERVTS